MTRSVLGIALGLALLATACGGSMPVEEVSAPFTADVGCDPRMSAALEQWVERGVGASVVDVGGDRQCVAAFGVADQETGRLNTVDTAFSIGSVTKPITAAAIFDLIDAGILTLDDTAGQHVPGLSGLPAESTIRNLLLHTTGISGEHGFDHVAMTKADAITRISDLEQSSTPGSAFLYNNTNYSVLALIIDEVTTQGYRQYVVDEILLDRDGNPLNAGWWDGTPNPVGPRAWGYVGDVPAKQRGDAVGPHWAMDGNGAMAMSPLAMAEWTWAFFNERILSPEATKHFLSTSTRLAGDGLEISGWGSFDAQLLGVEFFHTSGGGSGIGHQMDVVWLPRSERVVVLARNAIDHDVDFFIDGVLPAFVVGTGIPTPPIIPEALIDTTTMTGTFQVGDGGVMAVEENDGALVVELFGTDALAAFYPVPERVTEEVEMQLAAAAEKREQVLAGEVVAFELRQMNRMIELYGPLQDIAIEDVFYEGRINVVATATFGSSTERDHTLRAYFHTNLFGTTEFFVEGDIGLADLTMLLVYTDDLDGEIDAGAAGFAEREPLEGVRRTVLRPAPGGIEIDSIAGTTFAERQD